MFLVYCTLGLFGFAISLYSFVLEQRLKTIPSYKPFCDISDRISCSKPLKSSYAHLFGFSNAALGVIFYALVCALAYLEATTLLFGVLLAGCIASCYLAYLLYVKIGSFCLVCTATYLINFAMLIVFLLTSF